MKKMLLLMVLLLCVGFASAELDVQISDLQSEVLYSPYGDGAIGISYSASVTVRNVGDTFEAGVIELGSFPAGVATGLDLRSIGYVSNQANCEVGDTHNVHRVYVLSPGEYVNFELSAERLDTGTFDIILNHATKCASDSKTTVDFAAKEPYGLEAVLETISTGDAWDRDSDVQCETPFQALVAERASGNELCVAAACIDGDAVCTKLGACIPSDEQHQTCDDGSSPVIRTCNDDGEWVSTGNACSGESVDPVPEDAKVEQSKAVVVGVSLAVLFILMIAAVLIWWGIKK